MHPLLDKFFNLILPFQCVNCHRLGDTPWCLECRISTPLDPQIRDFPPEITKAKTLFAYTHLKPLFHAYKFMNIRTLDHCLIDHTLALVPQCPLNSPDFILPVPSHQNRVRERGFDHVTRLFQPLAQQWGLPLISAVNRSKDTPFLHALKTPQRAKAVHNAFTLSTPTLIAGKRLLLVDDILTSGATVQEIAKLLHQHGAAQIQVLALAG